MNKKLEIPKILITFANFVFIISIILSLVIFLYSLWRLNNPIYNEFQLLRNQYIFYYLTCFMSLLSSIFFTFAIRLNNNLKVNLSLVTFSIFFSVYCFEIFLEFSKEQIIQKSFTYPNIEKIAEEKGLAYDTRTKLEVIIDLNNSGFTAFPNIRPLTFRNSNGLPTDNGRIFPLGMISNVTTIFENEGGYFPIINTDEYGFNNPKGFHKSNLDVILIGDSFAEGESVHPYENISAVLRKKGLRSINIAKSGNGPLIQLATLIEYAKPLKPKNLVWVYFERNDFTDMMYELSNPILKNYLEVKDYTQNLNLRQSEIDELLIKYVNEKLLDEKNKQSKRYKEQVIRENIAEKSIIRIVKIFNFRKLINLRPNTNLSKYDKIQYFKKIIKKSNKIVSEWGGKFYFIYLTDFMRYYSGEKYKYRDEVLEIMNELNIPIIDMHTKVFQIHSDPLSLFPFRSKFHYNAEGYRLLAEEIYQEINSN